MVINWIQKGSVIVSDTKNLPARTATGVTIEMFPLVKFPLLSQVRTVEFSALPSFVPVPNNKPELLLRINAGCSVFERPPVAHKNIKSLRDSVQLLRNQIRCWSAPNVGSLCWKIVA